MVENVFLNLGQPLYVNSLFFGCRFPGTYTVIEEKTGFVRYYTGKKLIDMPKNSNGFYET